MTEQNVIVDIHEKRPQINSLLYGLSLISGQDRFDTSLCPDWYSQYNIPDLEVTPTIEDYLRGFVHNWTQSDSYQYQNESERSFFPESIAKTRAMIKRLSATDHVMGMPDKEDGVIVEKGGQRFPERGKEMSQILDQTTIEENGISWGMLSEQDRRFVAGLLMFAATGGMLERLNYMQDVDNIPAVVARELSVLEKISGQTLFSDLSDDDLLEKLGQYDQMRSNIVANRGLATIRLTEGRRRDVIVDPQVITPEQTTLNRIRANIAEDSTTDQSFFNVLSDAVREFGDGAIIFTRCSNDPIKDGDKVVGYAIIRGKQVKYQYRIVKKDDKWIFERDNHFCEISSDQIDLPNHMWRPKEDVDVGASSDDDIIHALGDRLLGTNNTAKRNNGQIGAEIPEIGWGLAYDVDGFMNNPGHAFAGINHMVRTELIPERDSSIRIWRSSPEKDAGFKIEDISTLMAYRQATLELLNGNT